MQVLLRIEQSWAALPYRPVAAWYDDPVFEIERRSRGEGGDGNLLLG